jgi:glycosyltransferase involved in cell wall biosynthesis
VDVIIASGSDPLVPRASGIRSYVINLALNLARKDVNVTVLGWSSGDVEDDLGFKFVRITKAERISSIVFLIKLFLMVGSVKMEKNVIIHAQRPDVLFPFLLFHRRNPKICTLHGMPYLGVEKRKGFITSAIYNILENFSLRYSNKIITVDGKARDLYINRYKRISDKMLVVPVGIDLSKFKPRSKAELRRKHGFGDEKIIVFAGRLEPEKRVDSIIEAFKMLEKGFDARLVIAGDGSERKRLERMANDRINFMGTVSHEAVAEMLSLADVTVLSSQYEGFPTVILESLASGTPVVSSNVGDVSKVVVDGKTGYLTDGSSENLKDKISIILNNSDDFESHCVEMARQYSWDVIAERIFEIYAEVHNEVSEES